MKKIILLIGFCFVANLQANQIMSLDWEDLIPASERLMLDIRQQQAERITNDRMLPIASGLGEVRSDLNGKLVKIPGFVIPLEGDEQTITEMLLVPYFGACYHVPPPPANQIIHVTFEQGVEIKELWDVVFIVGELRAQATSHELAEVGYSIEGLRVEDYIEEEVE